MSRIPVYVVTSIEEAPADFAVMGLQWDLPSPVVVTHRVDPTHGHLTRVVTDVTGEIEHAVIDLNHACLQCAIREDVVPTLDRLAGTGRWSCIIARLPVAAEARQVCRSLAMHSAPQARVAGVVAALSDNYLEFDLTCDEHLSDRSLAVFPHDERGVSEVASALVEYADIVALMHEDSLDTDDDDGRPLVRALARPGAMIVEGWPGFEAHQLLDGIHDPDCTEEWVAPIPGIRTDDVDDQVWRLELTSPRPFHPQRLMAHFEDFGAGTFRSRGCFWVPSRPDIQCVWDGAGGQLSIGSVARWSPTSRPLTRIVVTGLKAHGDAREHLLEAFESCLVDDAELSERGPAWEMLSDGLEPWLGTIHGGV